MPEPTYCCLYAQISPAHHDRMLALEDDPKVLTETIRQYLNPDPEDRQAGHPDDMVELLTMHNWRNPGGSPPPSSCCKPSTNTPGNSVSNKAWVAATERATTGLEKVLAPPRSLAVHTLAHSHIPSGQDRGRLTQDTRETSADGVPQDGEESHSLNSPFEL